jgi:hypothetical protein
MTPKPATHELIISPYAKRGFVSHVHYEHGTIVKFAEDVFGLPGLGVSDTRANSPDDAFDSPRRPASSSRSKLRRRERFMGTAV